MKKILLTLILALGILSVSAQAPTFAYPESYKIDNKDVARAEKVIGNPPAVPVVMPNPHPDAQWFPQASLGLFMHWGIHSVVGAQPSWDMIANYIYGGKVSPPDKYYALAKEFDPQQYDPDKWLKAAKAAGFNYAVLTTKHHDGYALWPSKYGIGTKQYLDGRDLIQPYVDACRANGMKVGLYFSPRDWHYPGLMHPNEYDADKWDLPREGITDSAANYRDYVTFLAFAMQQMEEILTRYGKIDVLWLDGMNFRGIDDMHTEQIYAWLRTLQPGMVINDRWSNITNPDDPHGSGMRVGDFTTPFECQLPTYMPSRWWDCCHIWTTEGGCGWGYDSTGSFRSYGWFFEHLAACRSLGGNFLINVGPGPQGDMPPNYYGQMNAIAQWMVHSRESLIGADSTPGAQLSNVRITTRGNAWYLHILPDFTKDISVETGKEPVSVTLLRTGQKVPYIYRDGFLNFKVDPALRTDMDDVVKITL